MQEDDAKTLDGMTPRELLEAVKDDPKLLRKLIGVLGAASDYDLAWLGRRIEQATRAEARKED